jgi:hypothetical protein
VLEIYKPRAKEIKVCNGLKKFEIGEPNKKFREKTILVVGATGTGKTTFLNSMVNYLYDVKQEDNFRFKIVTQDDEGRDDAKSKTKHVSAYCFNDTKLPYRLVVVDTPGYGDTEGLAADKQTTGLIKNLFENQGENGINHLDAVCIVVKSSDSRLNAQQRHNFNSVLQLFGKDVAANLFIIATFCDASEPPVKASLRAAGIDYSKFFKFNNSAFFEGFHDKNDEEKEFQKFFWKTGQTCFKNFLFNLESTLPVSLALSAEVLQRRQQLEMLVMDLHGGVKRGVTYLEQLRQEALIMEKFEAQIKANKSFTYTIRQSKIVHEDISGQGIHTTTCLTCNYTCHSDCTRADNYDKAKCRAMSPAGYCIICPRNCHWTLHKNLPYRITTVEEEVTQTDEDLCAKYLDATDKKRSKEKMLENLGRMFVDHEKQSCSTITNIRENLLKLHVA